MTQSPLSLAMRETYDQWYRWATLHAGMSQSSARRFAEACVAQGYGICAQGQFESQKDYDEEQGHL